jgi:hypothetical protein
MFIVVWTKNAGAVLREDFALEKGCGVELRRGFRRQRLRVKQHAENSLTLTSRARWTKRLLQREDEICQEDFAEHALSKGCDDSDRMCA